MEYRRTYHPTEEISWHKTTAKYSKYALCLSLVIWVGSWIPLALLPSFTDMLPETRQQPVQTPTDTGEFIIHYKNNKVDVTPIAEYEIWGMVASHNDPGEWYSFDLTHDDQSIDTRDLCIVWGKNLKSNEYKQVSFSNDDYACRVEWSGNINFNPYELSNNHMITDREDIRRKIAHIHTGDQVHIKGRLVNYSEERWRGKMRRTSVSRDDSGNGACEIIFVQELEVMKPYHQLWHWVNTLSGYGIFLFAFLCFLMMFF